MRLYTRPKKRVSISLIGGFCPNFRKLVEKKFLKELFQHNLFISIYIIVYILSALF